MRNRNVFKAPPLKAVGRTRENPHDRTGVSLLEVLMAIGVLSVGLLGVAALIPLAMHQAERGLSTDRAAAAARRAYREFEVRGMGNPDVWLPMPLPGPIVQVPTVTPTLGAAYCLDPVGFTSGSPFRFNESATSSTAQMRRIGVRVWERPTLPPPTPQRPDDSIIETLYREIFSASDDLEFDRPENVSQKPSQTFLGSPDPQKRLSAGRFSWMATLVPDWRSGSDLYTLSIVVFSRAKSPASPQDMRQFDTVNFYGEGIGGGDVGLGPSSAADVEVIRSGSWIMMGQIINNTQYFRWFRVLSVGDIDNNTLNVTIAGPDWNDSVLTQATWVKGVVAVFEKTIRLEGSSLWTN